MPFIRVSYLERQYGASQTHQISKTIMNALIEHFHVPEDDLFQVFHTHKREEFYYSTNYLGVERSDGLLFIQITCKSGRTTEQKTSFYDTLAKRLAASVPVRKEDVFVVLVDTEFEDWSFGNGVAQMLQRTPAEEAWVMAHRKIGYNVSEVYGEIAPAFVRYSEDVLLGEMWRREQLSLRDRSLITVATLAAGGMTEQLPYHLHLAMENGIRPEELVEAITHLAFYAGWPRAASALLVIKEVSKEQPDNQL